MLMVRTVGADEWATVREVRLRALADAPYAFTSSLKAEAALDEAAWRAWVTRGQWFVAEDHEHLVGTACGVPGRSPEERELVAMWVAETHRRRGVARSLLRAVARWASEGGATLLTLGVIEGNRRAEEAYLAMGLYPTGRREQAWNDPERWIDILGVDVSDPGRFS
jgi:GNAT superfamily N-acetyltransferase